MRQLGRKVVPDKIRLNNKDYKLSKNQELLNQTTSYRQEYSKRTQAES